VLNIADHLLQDLAQGLSDLRLLVEGKVWPDLLRLNGFDDRESCGCVPSCLAIVWQTPVASCPPHTPWK
jgi:hypothetical protein